MLLSASIVSLFLVFQVGSQCVDENAEIRLYKYLIEKYDVWNPDRVLRPVLKTTDTVQVQFGLNLIKLMKFDDDSETGTFLFYENYEWNDPYLKWNPDDFDGIKDLHVPVSKIWRPDMTVYGNPEPLDSNANYNLAVLSNDGKVVFVPPVKREVSCPEDDGSINCTLKFGSWTFSSQKIKFAFYGGHEDVLLDYYTPSKKLKLEKTSAASNMKKYPCCDDEYQDLTYQMVFKKGDDKKKEE